MDRDAEIVDPKDAEIALLKRQLATLKREMKRQSLERLLAAERKFFERMQDKLAQDSLGMCTDPKSKDALAPNKRSKIAQASNPQPNKLAVSLCLLSTLSNTVLSHSCVRTCTSSFVTPCAPPAHPPFPPNIGLRLVARSTGTRAPLGRRLVRIHRLCVCVFVYVCVCSVLRLTRSLARARARERVFCASSRAFQGHVTCSDVSFSVSLPLPFSRTHTDIQSIEAPLPAPLLLIQPPRQRSLSQRSRGWMTQWPT
jgi:hypothetical protein